MRESRFEADAWNPRAREIGRERNRLELEAIGLPEMDALRALGGAERHLDWSIEQAAERDRGVRLKVLAERLGTKAASSQEVR